MLKVHVMGHVHVTMDGQPLPISVKAVALLAYLALERQPQHREHLVELLWGSPDGRQNLRVVLTRMRAVGLTLFPGGKQLLSLDDVATDLDAWLTGLPNDATPAQLNAWLSELRGQPLSGLEDLGTPQFREWVDQQRWTINEQIEGKLIELYDRSTAAGRPWASRQIAARAHALGFDELTSKFTELSFTSDVHPDDWHIPRAEERALERAFTLALQRPHLVVLDGDPGYGKTYLVRRLVKKSQWHTLDITVTSSIRLILNALARGLMAWSSPDTQNALREVLLSPSKLKRDLTKVLSALASAPHPVTIVFDNANNTPEGFETLLEQIMALPGQRLVFILKRPLHGGSGALATLRHHVPDDQKTEIELSELTESAVQASLGRRLPNAPDGLVDMIMTRVLQRTSGHPHYTVILLDKIVKDGWQSSLVEASLNVPDTVRNAYHVEILAWPEFIREALQRVSAIQGSFDEGLVRTALGVQDGRHVEHVLSTSFTLGALKEFEPASPLLAPAWTAQAAPMTQAPEWKEARYTFRDEALRVTLAGKLPHPTRLRVWRDLADHLAESAPGHAAYYARRAHLNDLAAELEARHRAKVASQPATLRPPMHPRPDASVTSLVAPPARHAQSRDHVVFSQGYRLVSSQGWLRIGRFGGAEPPPSLSLHFPLPRRGQHSSTLRLVWRLDAYSGGEECGAVLVSFPLRVRVLGGDAHVFTLDSGADYTEHGVLHHLHAAAQFGNMQWMEYQLLVPPHVHAQCLEVSLRARDVALVIGELTWDGVSLLSASAAPDREHPAFS